MESELKEIHPRLTFVNSRSTNFQDFDFIVACGRPNLINFAEINNLARKSSKCNTLCFEYDGKFFLWNDFVEFPFSTPNGSRMLTFPSYNNILNNNRSHSKKNALLDSFYEAVSGKHGNNIILINLQKFI